MKFANVLRTPFLQNSFSGYFWVLTRVFKGVQNTNRCDCQQWILYSDAKMYLLPQKFRSSHPRCSVKEVCNFIIRKRLEYCKVFKNTYFEKHLWAAASENQHLTDKFRSCRPEVFCKKGVLRNFAKFAVKHLCQSLLFNKLQAWDSGTGVFLWILWNF